MESKGYIWLRIGKVASTCKHGNKTGFRKMSVIARLAEDLLVLAFQGIVLRAFGYTDAAARRADFDCKNWRLQTIQRPRVLKNYKGLVMQPVSRLLLIPHDQHPMSAVEFEFAVHKPATSPGSNTPLCVRLAINSPPTIQSSSSVTTEPLKAASLRTSGHIAKVRTPTNLQDNFSFH